MNIRYKYLCIVLGLFLMLTIVGAGCSATRTDMSKNIENEIRDLVHEYYTNLVEGNYDKAVSYLLFSERTEDMKVWFPGCYETDLIQSFTISEITKLTDELYKVNVVGITLMPYELVYDQKGNIIGSNNNEGLDWYINCFDADNYVALSDGKWGFCISARYVPEGMYDFSENELEVGVAGSVNNENEER